MIFSFISYSDVLIYTPHALAAVSLLRLDSLGHEIPEDKCLRK